MHFPPLEPLLPPYNNLTLFAPLSHPAPLVPAPPPGVGASRAVVAAHATAARLNIQVCPYHNLPVNMVRCQQRDEILATSVFHEQLICDLLLFDNLHARNIARYDGSADLAVWWPPHNEWKAVNVKLASQGRSGHHQLQKFKELLTAHALTAASPFGVLSDDHQREWDGMLHIRARCIAAKWPFDLNAFSTNDDRDYTINGQWCQVKAQWGWHHQHATASLTTDSIWILVVVEVQVATQRYSPTPSLIPSRSLSLL